jgi:hypothetical protein
MTTRKKTVFAGLLILMLISTGVAPIVSGQATPATVQVHMVVTAEPLEQGDTNVAALNTDDVQVRQGRNDLKVTGWIPGRGDQAAAQLLILIDETSDHSLGSHLDELRAFIEAQPATTLVGLGYMRNTGVNILQNFTTDHALVAKALRLPLGSVGATDSPYLSLISVMKGWPENKMRRQVLMITDGIDRLHGDPGPMGPSTTMRGMPLPTMPYISADVDSASIVAQKASVIVHSIYTRGVGRIGRSRIELDNGQNGLSKLADETGGEAFMLGYQNAVSFQPYLEQLQRILDNQYFLVFEARPGKKSDLQRVKIKTSVAKLEIVAANNVWVPVAAASGASAAKNK